MIVSMTGYANADVVIEGKMFNIEIKSYNNKGIETNIKTPAILRPFENDLKNLIQQQLLRGSVDVNISIRKDNTLGGFNLNAAQEYYLQLKNLTQLLNIPEQNVLELILKNPEVSNSIETKVFGEYEKKLLFDGIQQLIDQVINFRKSEGINLAKDIQYRIAEIEKLKNIINTLAPIRIENQKSVLKKRIEQANMADKMNHDRFEQEMIYYLEKLDITEELIRFDSHCMFFKNVLNENSEDVTPKGKKLNFIIQEILREINTVGSKAQDSDIQKTVILIKDEIEKIKEQLNNIV